jgi:imidazolonepropionase-like amidohydrolase
MIRRLKTAGVSVSITAGALVAAQTPPAARFSRQTEEPVALVHANVVNVRDGAIARDATVVLREGRIQSIALQPAPAGVKSIDLRGKYLVPGLIDAHTHIGDLAAARRALESGVTTVRSSGVSNYADVGLRELVRQGTLAGPDIVATGYHVRPRLADEAFLNDPKQANLLTGVDTVEELRQAVRMNLARGVDWIKVLATERAGTADTDPRKQVYTEAELRAVVEEAATRNVPVQAHAHGDEGAMAAVRAGVRSIEHGTYLSDATLAVMKEKGTYLVPTYAIVTDVAGPGGDYDVPALQIRGRHMVPRLRETIQRARAAGVKIVVGVDTGYGPNSLVRAAHEVAELVDMGFTPLQALQAATIRDAEMLRLDKSIGVVAEGFEADLVAVEGNPLTNIRVLQDPLLVISNGRVAVNRLDFGRPEARQAEGRWPGPAREAIQQPNE